MVLSSNPGKIIAEVLITLPHPRDRLSVEFNALMDKIYDLMTINLKSSTADIITLHGAEPMQMDGVMEILVSPPYNGHADLPKLAKSRDISSDNLFTIMGALQLLQFIELSEWDIHITAAGRVYLEGNTEERRKIFGRHLVEYVPLVSHIRRILQDSKGAVEKKILVHYLQDKYNAEEITRILHTITLWGRYGNLFMYNEVNRTFHLM